MATPDPDRVLIRPADPDDAPAIYAYYRDPRVARTTLGLPSAELTTTLQWIKNWSPRRQRLVATVQDRVIGSLTLAVSTHPRQPRCGSIGLIVHPDYWGIGVGGKLLLAALDLADNWLDLQRIELDVFAENKGAVHLYQKHGFVIEGTSRRNVFAAGRWQAEHAMARFVDELPSSASPFSFATSAPSRQEMATARIRPVALTDAAGLHALWRHPAVARQVFALPSMEIQQVRRFIAEPPAGAHRLVLAAGEEILGFGLLTAVQRPRLQHTGRLTLMIHPTCWDRGGGTRLLGALLDLADGWLNLQRLEATVLDDNPGAMALLGRAGFAGELVHHHYAFRDGVRVGAQGLARLRNLPSSPQPPGLAARPQRSETRAAGAKVAVRPPAADDAHDLHAFLSDPGVGRTTLQLPSHEAALWERRVQEVVPGLHRWVADVDGHAVGLAALHLAQKPNRAFVGSIGMSVHPEQWGRGIGTALMEAIVNLADSWLGLERLELEVNVDNPAGIRLYEKFGFVAEGVRQYHAYGAGRWGHSHVMARLRTRPTP